MLLVDTSAEIIRAKDAQSARDAVAHEAVIIQYNACTKLMQFIFEGLLKSGY